MFNQFNAAAMNGYNPQAALAMQQYANRMNLYGQQPQQTGGLQFVNGRESVDAFPMGPNDKVLLMDSTRARFYIKETDAAGMARVSAYDFTEANDAPAQPDYVTRQEFDQLRSDYESLIQSIQASNQATSDPGGDKRGNARNDRGQGAGESPADA